MQTFITCAPCSSMIVNRTRTFVGDGHFERYADNSHQVFSWYQRAQDGANTQSLTFPLVDELKKTKGK